MCYSAWGDSVAPVDCVTIHPSQTLVELEELAAVLEKVAGFFLAIMLVDVEVHVAWPRQFVLNCCCGCLFASAALPCLRGFPGVAVSTAAIAVVAVVVAPVSVADCDHVDIVAIIVDAHSTLASAIASALEFCFVIGVNAVFHRVFSICLPIRDFHQVINCFGLRAAQLFPELYAANVAVECVDCAIFRDVLRGVLDDGPPLDVRA